MTRDDTVGVVLAGGASLRMGRPKGALPFGGRTLLEWMVRLVGQAAGEVWVAAAAEEPGSGGPKVATPVAPAGARLLPDEASGAGPLAVLHGALVRLARPVLFVACDLPFLDPGDLRALATAEPGADAVLLEDDRGAQPLAGCYRPPLVPAIADLRARGESSMQALLAVARPRTRRAAERFPGCSPLANLNTPEEYAAALVAARAAGLIR